MSLNTDRCYNCLEILGTEQVENWPECTVIHDCLRGYVSVPKPILVYGGFRFLTWLHSNSPSVKRFDPWYKKERDGWYFIHVDAVRVLSRA